MNPNFYSFPYYDYPPEDFNLIPNEFYGHHLFYGGPAGTLYPYSNFQFKPSPLYERRSFLELPKNKFARDFFENNFHKRSAEPLLNPPTVFMSNQYQDAENTQAENLNSVNMAAANSNNLASSKDKESANTLVNKRQSSIAPMVPQIFSSNQFQDIENLEASNLNNAEMSATSSNTFANSKDQESANTMMFHKRNQSQPSDEKRSIALTPPSVFSSNQNQDIENTEAANLNTAEMSANNANTLANSKDIESSNSMFLRRILPPSKPFISTNQNQDLENLEAANLGTVEMSANNANAFQSSKNVDSSNTFMIHKRNHLKSSAQERSILPNLPLPNSPLPNSPLPNSPLPNSPLPNSPLSNSPLGFFSNQNQDIENTEAANLNNVEMSATNANNLQSSKDGGSSNTFMIHKKREHKYSDQGRSILPNAPLNFLSKQDQDIENTEAANLNNVEMSATNANAFASSKDQGSAGNVIIKKRNELFERDAGIQHSLDQYPDIEEGTTNIDVL
ncbi:2955_t:CDS:1 [Dentiscutata heterogama]|uniref:2955_t:CDS:1 n=1 Tax=Dentiscutata heterogama TaxID=1316150 RepID=A0ACA9LZD3_9GLOM|nr:2955_t:CDS:1 [Dentiscutata heterogama]